MRATEGCMAWIGDGGDIMHDERTWFIGNALRGLACGNFMGADCIVDHCERVVDGQPNLQEDDGVVKGSVLCRALTTCSTPAAFTAPTIGPASPMRVSLPRAPVRPQSAAGATLSRIVALPLLVYPWRMLLGACAAGPFAHLMSHKSPV